MYVGNGNWETAGREAFMKNTADLRKDIRFMLDGIYAILPYILSEGKHNNNSNNNSRSLPKPIVRTTTINGRSPKAVAPTCPIHVHHPKNQLFEQFQLTDSLWKKLSAQFQSVGSLRDHLSGQFQLIVLKHRTSIVQTVPIYEQSLKAIVRAISIEIESPKTSCPDNSNC